MDSGHALLVFPGGIHGRIADDGMRRWLSRGRLSMQIPENDTLHAVLTAIGAPIPAEGFAALRFWGQTGERSASWIAAADPVHLQPTLRDLRVRALSVDQYSRQELDSLFDNLQTELGVGDQFAFAKLGKFGYLHANEPLALPHVSAAIADGHVPDRFTASGVVSKVFHQLLGEVQMLLHAHAVNTARQGVGAPEINSLWFWGGGFAPEKSQLSLPNLFADDPLFAGYWASGSGRAAAWHSIDHCVDVSPQGFVAVVPELLPSAAGQCAELAALEKHLHRGVLRRLTLLFSNGLTIEMNKYDRIRLWRGISPLLEDEESE